MTTTGRPEFPDEVRRRAARRALAVVAGLNFLYALAAASPYALAALSEDAGLSSFAAAAGVILLETALVSAPGWLLGWRLWRAGRARAAAAACLTWLVLAGFLLRADALMFPIFRQHAYGALAVGCLLQGDPAALGATPGQIALYGFEALAVLGLQWPALALLRRFLAERLPARSARWFRPALAAAGGAGLVLALGAWTATRWSRRRAQLLAMQRGLLVPLAGRERAPVPSGIVAAVESARRRALAGPEAWAGPAWAEPPAVSRAPERRPNVVVIVAESLRADAFSPEVMPEMSRLAAEATVAAGHRTNGNTTYLALFSLFCGQDPSGWDLAVRRGARPAPLEALRRSGYRLHVVSASSLAWWGLDRTVLPRDMFDTYAERSGDPVADDLATVEAACRVIDSARTGEPFFLAVFLYSTHWSYYFPRDCARFSPWMRDVELNIGPALILRREELVNRYRNAAFFVDRCAGRVVARLRERGLCEDSVVVFCGDHGESFHETGSFCHGAALADQEAATPLLVRWPGRPARRVELPTQHDDLMPSVLAFMGLESPQVRALSGRPRLLDAPGRSFTAVGAGKTGSPERWMLTAGRRRIFLRFSPRRRSLVVEAYRDAGPPEGWPVAEAGTEECAAAERVVYEWLTGSGAAVLLRPEG